MFPHNATLCQYMYLISNLRVCACLEQPMMQLLEAGATMAVQLFCLYLAVTEHNNLLRCFLEFLWEIPTTQVNYTSNCTNYFLRSVSVVKLFGYPLHMTGYQTDPIRTDFSRNFLQKEKKHTVGRGGEGKFPFPSIKHDTIAYITH